MSESKEQMEREYQDEDLALKEEDPALQERERLFLYETAFKIPSKAWVLIDNAIDKTDEKTNNKADKKTDDKTNREMHTLTLAEIEELYQPVKQMYEATISARSFLSHSLNNPKLLDLSKTFKKMTFEKLLKEVEERFVKILLMPVACTFFLIFDCDSETESDTTYQKILAPTEAEIRDILRMFLRRGEKISAEDLEGKIAEMVNITRGEIHEASKKNLSNHLRELNSLIARSQKTCQELTERLKQPGTPLPREQQPVILSSSISSASASLSSVQAQVPGFGTKP